MIKATPRREVQICANVWPTSDSIVTDVLVRLDNVMSSIEILAQFRDGIAILTTAS